MSKDKKPEKVLDSDKVDNAKAKHYSRLHLSKILKEIKDRKTKLPYYGEFIGEQYEMFKMWESGH